MSGLFLDVKSAYPSVHKKRLADNLWKRNCPNYLVRQVEEYLEKRTTDLRLQDFLSEKFSVDDGLPQGSPLSVILYIVYNLSLLINLDVDVKSDKISLGFIDDVTHLVANKDVDMNVLELEEEGARSLEWGRRHGAIFDQNKAQVIHMTHRKHQNPKVFFGEQVLEPKKELRWLGLWLNPKRNFGCHIQKMQQQGKMTLIQLSRINKCYWGTNPRETKNLIMAVLKPRILFVCVVWFNTRTEGKVMKIFNLLQNSANRLALGAFKSSPVTFMNHDANMAPFTDLAIKYTHNFIYKRLTAPECHPTRRILDIELFNTPQTLPSPMHKVLRKSDILLPSGKPFEIIYPYPEPPWSEPQGEVTNVNDKREVVKERIPEQVELEKEKGACVIFTDGSYIPDVGGGAAAAMEGGVVSKAYGPIEGISNFEMEAMGLILGMVTYIILTTTNQPNRFKALALFSDSQAALDLITRPLQPSSLQYLAQSLRRAIRQIPVNHPVSLYWTPGHEGIKLNEEADIAAKGEAEGEAEVTMLPISLGSLLRHAKTRFKRGAVHIKKFKTQGKYIADTLNNLEKGQAAAIFQLRCGHNPLRSFLHQIGVNKSSKCEVCNVTENTTHFLIFCKRFRTQQQVLRARLKEKKTWVDINSATKLLDTTVVFPYLAQYIEDTGRFTHLKTYLGH